MNSTKQDGNEKKEITISIDSNILNKIKNDSMSNLLTTNSKINSILRKYVDFYRAVEIHGLFIIPKEIHGKLIEQVDEKNLIKLLNGISQEQVRLLLLRNKVHPDIDDLYQRGFQTIFLWSGMYDKYSRFEDGGFTYIMLEHKQNKKWSFIMGEVFSHLIKYLSISGKVDYETSDTSVTLRVKNVLKKPTEN